MRISAIINELERFANPALQEQWDNTGLQVGSVMAECTGVLVCLDVTLPVVAEAKQLGCNLIVSHHPLFFKPVKRLTGATVAEAVAIEAIASGIAIYSSHTATDSTVGGVSYEMAKLLGVEPLRVIQPVSDRLVALQTMVPASHEQQVRAALFDAGAGAIGNYDCCSFSVEGQGAFRALDGAEPFVGEVGEIHTEDEVAVTVVLERELMSRVESALLETHPYETPAYFFIPLLNKQGNVGLGVYGTSDEGLSPLQFAEKVKKTFGCQAVRVNAPMLDADIKIRRVAMCGGAGGEFIGKALAMGAQAYVSGDIRHHDFVEYADRILLIDAGHYDTEAPISRVFAKVISSHFADTPVHISSINDNPIKFI